MRPIVRACSATFLVAAAVAAAAAAGARAAARQQQPSFRSAVDLVAVDVQVVDSQGRAVRTLKRDDFAVSIDGERRSVVSAQLVEFAGRGTTGARETGASRPEGDIANRGRTFVLAIDTKSFDPGDTLPVVKAALDFVAAAGQADRIGLFTLGIGGARVAPTTDRFPLRQALSRTIGQRPTAVGQFHLSVSEIIDVLATSPNALVAATTVAPVGGRGTAAPIIDMADPLQRVQARECGRTTDAGCTAAILAEAAALAHDLEDRVTQTLAQLSILLDALSDESSGRVTVVLLSAGMPLSDRVGGRLDIGGEVRTLGELAAHANATIYALHLDLTLPGTYGAASRRVADPGAMAREYRLSGHLLEDFADAAGGTRLGVPVGNGSIALDRVLRETSAYYLLGVDLGSVPRDGRAHHLSVHVGGRGYTLRSRQWVVLPRTTR